MTDNELHDAVSNDASAKALADSGDDSGAAIAASALVSKKIVPTYVVERGIIDAFDDIEEGNDALDRLHAASSSSTLLARVVSWLNPANGGVDMGNTKVRDQLDAMAAGGILTTHQVTILKRTAERSEAVSASDISRVWAQYREGGKIS